MGLQETLDQIKAGAAERIPTEARQVMAAATAELEASGLADRALGVGDTAPDFALQDHSGKLHPSTELLAKGPLILSFFRGSW